ncbi:MAG: hypothetical protein AABZ30_04290 [Myxococcota bacterium]
MTINSTRRTRPATHGGRVAFLAAALAAAVALAPATARADMMMMGMGHGHDRSPGLAALLSLTPVPIDFGNFYAENWGWGVGYTVGEIALFAPMMALAMGDGWGHHDRLDGTDDEWTRSERIAFYSLLGGYVVVKSVAAIHAARAAEAYNRRAKPHASLMPAPLVLSGGGGAGLVATF